MGRLTLNTMGHTDSPLMAVLIGLGKQALDDHIPALLRRADVKIVGVCDIDPEACRRFYDRYPALGSIPVFTNFNQLLQTQPDFAVVAVPHDTYGDIVSSLCARRIYFLKEKPLARNVAEARLLETITGFERYGFVATQRHFGRLYQEACKALPMLGTFQRASFAYTLRVAEPASGWRGSRQRAGGGCLLDMGYHLVDQIQWWLGPADEVVLQSWGRSPLDDNDSVEQSASVLFRYSSGLCARLYVSRTAHKKDETYEIYGSCGSLIGSRSEFVVKDCMGNIVYRMEEPNCSEPIDAQLDFFIGRFRKQAGFVDVHRRHRRVLACIDRCYGRTEKDWVGAPMKEFDDVSV